MAFSINDLIQTAAEDLNQVGDGEPVSGELAASYEGLVNRAIAELNADSYISLTVGYKEIMAAGSVSFKELEPGESPSNTINMYPPDTIAVYQERSVSASYPCVDSMPRLLIGRTLSRCRLSGTMGLHSRPLRAERRDPWVCLGSTALARWNLESISTPLFRDTGLETRFTFPTFTTTSSFMPRNSRR